MISCPLASQPGAAPLGERDSDKEVVTPLQSPWWDNYQESPAFKIPIVSTVYSDFESLGGRVFGISEICSDSGSDNSVFQVAEEAVLTTMGDYQNGEVILNGIISRIKQEIMLCPAEDIVTGMEAGAEKNLE